MKVLFLIATVGAVVASTCSASHLVAGPVAGAINTGSSSQYRSQDNLGQYSFGYDEAGATGGSFRHEKSDAYGNRVGSYGLTGADGRVRVVNYVADANGYRANVQTNEPGTEPRDPAAVTISRSPVAVAAPVAPLPLPVAAAPVAAYGPAPLAAPLPLAAAPLPAYAPLAPVAAPVAAPFGYGFSIINHHLPAPLPLAAAY